MNNNNENSLWVERYRPFGLEGYVGNEHIIEKVKIYIENNDVPHLLLYGDAGNGKTTLAKIIVNAIDCDYLYINASDERGIDTLREKIRGFAASVGFRTWKVVMLDECLDENTLVSVLRNGEQTKIPIRDLDEHNDLVKSWNVEKNEVQWRPFYHWDKGEQDVYEIELENGEIVICTDDHKWYVKDVDGNLKVIKTRDLHKYQHILSPQ